MTTQNIAAAPPVSLEEYAALAQSTPATSW